MGWWVVRRVLNCGRSGTGSRNFCVLFTVRASTELEKLEQTRPRSVEEKLLSNRNNRLRVVSHVDLSIGECFVVYLRGLVKTANYTVHKTRVTNAPLVRDTVKSEKAIFVFYSRRMMRVRERV